jgi:tRNA pseudouridine13 synthase
MKLKCRPEDFLVTELSEFPIRAKGEFAVYELTKRGLGTPEAITQLLQMWKVPRDKLSYGGLKDRHAVTKQFVTIYRGPARNAQRDQWDLSYLGQSDEPFQPSNISANRFQIIMRDMDAEECQRAISALDEVARWGLPNYFDDQRFGSVTSDGEFIARPWIAGDYERTMWLCLAAESPHDRSAEKREKATLRDHWGDWPTVMKRLGRSHRRSIISYLVQHPQDFKGAWARVRQDMRSLYLSAFQSHLWNKILATAIRSTCPEDKRVDVRLALGPAPFFRELTPNPTIDLATLMIPLPSSRSIYEDDAPITALTDLVLSTEGISREEIKIKHPRDSFFSKGERAAVIRATDVTRAEGDDTLYTGQRALQLSFSLPRGCYATILIKRITAAAGGSTSGNEPKETDSHEAEPHD